MRPSVRWPFPVALVAACLAAAPVAAAPEIKDDARFFSADAVSKANQAIKELKEQTARDLLIETFAEIPEGRKKDYKPETRDAFFAQWASVNAREHKVAGVYILLCKSPARVQVEVDKYTQRRAFPAAERDKLRQTIIAAFKEKKFDEGLSEAVTFAAKTFRANVEIKDEAGFFSADAVRKAIQEIVAIEQRCGRDFIVETFKEIPAGRKKDASTDKRAQLFADWARERTGERKVDGVYILVCKDPAHLETGVSGEALARAFTPKDRAKLNELLLKQFREKKFDAGLSEAIQFVDRTYRTNFGEKGSGG